MIATARLDLVPFSVGFLRASAAGDRDQASARLGVILPAEWPTYPDTFQLRRLQLEADPSLQPWLLRGMILRSTRELVGHLGFHTGPNPDYLRGFAPGGIELGYTVEEPFRRQGFATEAVAALIRWARNEHGLTRFVVSIRPDNVPSLKMASKFGFQRVGEHLDEVDGLEHVFCLDLPSTI
jgi:ribosomal-protein-alanine N-acetyltransferase